VRKTFVILTLLLIIYLTTLIEPIIKNINETTTGDYVRIRGEVTGYFTNNQLTIMTIKDNTSNIKVVFFKEEQAYKGMKIEVTGRVDYYEGEKELIGVKTKCLN
jgi:exonuclease VII large subunit